MGYFLLFTDIFGTFWYEYHTFRFDDGCILIDELMDFIYIF